MFYHASQVPGLRVLTPHVSNHGTPLVYLSVKRENVLVYLSNAVEKYCRESGFIHRGGYRKWASYGFTREGLLRLEEYYPGATAETYRGASGFIYSAETAQGWERQTDIPHAAVTAGSVAVTGCEIVCDAYEAIAEAAAEGKIVLQRYEENSAEKLRWIRETILREYAQAAEHPEYRAFLRAKFDFLPR